MLGGDVSGEKGKVGVLSQLLKSVITSLVEELRVRYLFLNNCLPRTDVVKDDKTNPPQFLEGNGLLVGQVHKLIEVHVQVFLPDKDRFDLVSLKFVVTNDEGQLPVQ